MGKTADIAVLRRTDGRRVKRADGVYVYGLIRGGLRSDLGAIGLAFGGAPSPVYTVSVGDIAAVVSRFAMGEHARVLPLRKNLGPHHEVLREVLATTTIIPMAFGHVARSDGEVLAFLRRERRAIQGELERVDGKVEMSLKVTWDVDNIVEHIVKLDADLRGARDRLFGRSRPPSREERIALGQMFEYTLSNLRDEQRDKVMSAFPPSLAEVTALPIKGERSVMSLAFLVARTTILDLERHVHEVARAFPPEYVFEVGGPWPPWSFVNLNLGSAT